MVTAIPINKKLFDIFLLFTREPFVQYFSKELEFYTNGNGSLLGLISLDITDNDYYGCILSRDNSKQFRAEIIKASIPTLDEAREWIDDKMSQNSIDSHENKNEFFDLFKDLTNKGKQHPNYILLKEHISLSSAKEVMKEVSFHYKDIDGDFIQQFQSLNGFDSRIWELYLFCFFREQFFSFKRNYSSPDYMIQKFNYVIAVEAVIISRKTNLGSIFPANVDKIPVMLKNEIPLLFGSAIFDKMKKKYWEREHVKEKPFVIAIADFHDTLSMTWTFSALAEYLYGYEYQHVLDENGILHITPIKVEKYLKKNGEVIQSGFFFLDGSENVSAIIFSSSGTLSKFNRMGKQAGLGDDTVILIRTGNYYNHKPNANKPIKMTYRVNESSNETWSEGVIVFHNPNAKFPLDKTVFDNRVAQCFFDDKMIISIMPELFPYSSFTQNICPKI